MQSRQLAIIAYLLFTAGCARESVESVTDVETPEKLILYSVDGRDFEPGNAPKVDEAFHGYPVLGKVEITEAEKRNEIIAAVKDGIARSDGKLAKCFWPRHAIRTIEKGKIANVIVTDGDLFEDRTRIVHIFVDGRKVEPEAPAPANGRGRGCGGA